MTPRDEGPEHEAHIEHEIDCAREAAHDEEIEKAISEVCASCHHSIGYCDCLDEEVDTSDWAVPPETEKMLRERIAKLEAYMEEEHENIQAELEQPLEKRSWERLGRCHDRARTQVNKETT